MNKNLLTSLVILIILVAGGAFLLIQKNLLVKEKVTYRMWGTLTSVELLKNKLTLKGVAESSEKEMTQVARTVEFTFDNNTKLVKNVRVIPKNIEPGVTYTPERREFPGQLLDLTAATPLIDLIESDDNLLVEGEAYAKSIKYTTYEMEK